MHSLTGEQVKTSRPFAMSLDEYRAAWCEALTLPGHASLRDSSLWEVGQRFPRQTADEIRRTFDDSTRLYAESWNAQGVDARSEQAVIDFYNRVDVDIFNLMRWHAEVEARTQFGPLHYLATLEVARAFGWGRSYLDFGSGVGTSAILFAKAGFDVTLADVAEPLLAFARTRLERRQLPATYIDLKAQALPEERFDVVTCFDVIEHTVKPLKVLRQIRRAIRPGGYLILNNADDVIAKEDPEHPMHIMHDRHLWRRLRGLGFEMDRWQLPKVWMRICGEPVFILRKVERPALTNWLLGVYDVRVPDAIKERLKPGKWLRALIGDKRHQT